MAHRLEFSAPMRKEKIMAPLLSELPGWRLDPNATGSNTNRSYIHNISVAWIKMISAMALNLLRIIRIDQEQTPPLIRGAGNQILGTQETWKDWYLGRQIRQLNGTSPNLPPTPHKVPRPYTKPNNPPSVPKTPSVPLLKPATKPTTLTKCQAHENNVNALHSQYQANLQTPELLSSLRKEVEGLLASGGGEDDEVDDLISRTCDKAESMIKKMERQQNVTSARISGKLFGPIGEKGLATEITTLRAWGGPTNGSMSQVEIDKTKEDWFFDICQRQFAIIDVEGVGDCGLRAFYNIPFGNLDGINSRREKMLPKLKEIYNRADSNTQMAMVDDSPNFSAYLAKMSKQGTHLGQLEFMALSQLEYKTVRIFDYGSSRIDETTGMLTAPSYKCFAPEFNSAKGEPEVINILFNPVQRHYMRMNLEPRVVA